MDYDQHAMETSEDHTERLRALLLERDREITDLRAQLSEAHPELAASPLPFGGAEELHADLEDRGEDGGGSADGLEEIEARLAEESQAAQNPAVLQLLAGLQAAAVYTDTPNHETNRKLWDAYAKDWAPDRQWLKKMAGHLPGESRELSCVGDEWSDKASLAAVIQEWIFPHSSTAVRVAEVGSGGGRVAVEVAQSTRELVCFDISAEMLKAARRHTMERGLENVRFQHVMGDTDYPIEYDGTFDFIYSFDVFVHLDLHQMRRTLRSIRKMLQPGGKCFVSFANLLAPDGWRRFANQRKYSVGGFYFASPDIVRCLLAKGGLELLSMSSPRAGDTYLNRDLLVLARRAPDALPALASSASPAA